MDDELGDIHNQFTRALLQGEDQIISANGISDQHKRLIDLARVDAALDRMADGNFGICTGCGDELDIEKLLKDPSVSKCMHCIDAKHLRKAV